MTAPFNARDVADKFVISDTGGNRLSLGLSLGRSYVVKFSDARLVRREVAALAERVYNRAIEDAAAVIAAQISERSAETSAAVERQDWDHPSRAQAHPLELALGAIRALAVRA